MTIKDSVGMSTAHEEHASTILNDIQTDTVQEFRGVEKEDIKLSEERHRAEIEYGKERCDAPDGGWGWFIVFGATLMNCFTAGMAQSNGIFYGKFQDRFHGSVTSTALVMSSAFCVRLVVGPIVSLMTQYYSCRCLTAIGAVIFSSSLIITGYIHNQHLLYLSFSLLSGVGRAFVLTPVHVILGQYFDKWRSRAFGFANSGINIGAFFISPLAEFLFQSYGYQGAFLILGGCCLQVLIGSALFRPINLHRQCTVKYTKLTAVKQHNNKATAHVYSYSSETSEVDNCEEDIEQRQLFLNQNSKTPRDGSFKSKNKSGAKRHAEDNRTSCIDLSILKDTRFLSFAFATVLSRIPKVVLFLPSTAKEKGLLATDGVFLISVVCGSNGLFSFLTGFIFDHKCIKYIRPQIYIGLTLCQGMIVALIPWVRTFQGLCILSALYGAVSGVKIAQKSVVMIDILGMDKIASSLAVSMSVQTLGAFIGPTLAGCLVDIYGTYDAAYYFFAAASFLAAVIMTLGHVCQFSTVKRRTKQIQREYWRRPFSYRRLPIAPPSF